MINYFNNIMNTKSNQAWLGLLKLGIGLIIIGLLIILLKEIIILFVASIFIIIGICMIILAYRLWKNVNQSSFFVD